MSELGGVPQVARLGGDVVTGEAVVLELREAKLPSRALAKIIDIAVQYAALLVLFILQGVASVAVSIDEAAVVAIYLVIVVAIFVGYPVLFETLTRGKTLGKMAMGLQVVRDDGGPVRFRHALVRGLMGIFEVWAFFVIAVLVSAFSPQGKRIGDYLAGTVVIRLRMPTGSAPMVVMPPQLAGWAAGLDLSRLPDELALAARQFMARVGSLQATVRGAMAVQLAQDVSRYVSPGPPPGVHPESYLAAVLAERRRRDQTRYAPVQVPVSWPPPTAWQPSVAGPPTTDGPVAPPVAASVPAPAGEPGFTLPF